MSLVTLKKNVFEYEERRCICQLVHELEGRPLRAGRTPGKVIPVPTERIHIPWQNPMDVQDL